MLVYLSKFWIKPGETISSIISNMHKFQYFLFMLGSVLQTFENVSRMLDKSDFSFKFAMKFQILMNLTWLKVLKWIF